MLPGCLSLKSVSQTLEKSFPGTNKQSYLAWLMHRRDGKPAHSKCKSKVQECKIYQESGSRATSPELSLREAIVQLVLQLSMWLCSQSNMQLCHILCHAKGNS